MYMKTTSCHLLSLSVSLSQPEYIIYFYAFGSIFADELKVYQDYFSVYFAKE